MSRPFFCRTKFGTVAPFTSDEESAKGSRASADLNLGAKSKSNDGASGAKKRRLADNAGLKTPFKMPASVNRSPVTASPSGNVDGPSSEVFSSMPSASAMTGDQTS